MTTISHVSDQFSFPSPEKSTNQEKENWSEKGEKLTVTTHWSLEAMSVFKIKKDW